MNDSRYGEVAGRPIDEVTIAALIENAEAGFPGATARSVGRPAMGERPARTVAVRLDPDLDGALLERLAQTGQTASELVREALRKFLAA